MDCNGLLCQIELLQFFFSPLQLQQTQTKQHNTLAAYHTLLVTISLIPFSFKCGVNISNNIIMRVSNLMRQLHKDHCRPKKDVVDVRTVSEGVGE